MRQSRLDHAKVVFVLIYSKCERVTKSMRRERARKTGTLAPDAETPMRVSLLVPVA